jgi:hypothetical protein
MYTVPTAYFALLLIKIWRITNSGWVPILQILDSHNRQSKRQVHLHDTGYNSQCEEKDWYISPLTEQ